MTYDLQSTLLPAASETLSRVLGGAARLEPGEVLDGRPHIMRCPVISSLADAPETVILKMAHHPQRPAYDPENFEPDSPTMVFIQDWLGVQFLDESRPAGMAPFSPRFYGGDRTLGYFMMEDLGTGESLANLLQGDNAERAEAGLLTYATTLGRMHATTLRQKERFNALCVSLGIPLEKVEPVNERRELNLEGWYQCCEELGVTLAPGIAEDVALLNAALQPSSPFYAYTHGDPCPDNNRISGESMRLFDFETGQFRNALADGVYGRVPFPTCWCVNRLPVEIANRMEAAYRTELATVCPEARDDTRFTHESLTLWGVWLLRTMHWQFPKVLTEDSEWGISTIRQRLLYRFRLFADATVTHSYLTALGQTARALANRFDELWGAETEPMPLYAAFRE